MHIRLKEILANPAKIKAFFVVTGAYQAGKSSFLRTVANGGLLTVDESDYFEYPEPNELPTTSTLGIVSPSPDTSLLFWESPGARRFDSLLLELETIPIGFFVLMDSRKPETFRETTSIVKTTAAYKAAPYCICANHLQAPQAWSISEIEAALRFKPLACDAKNFSQCRKALVHLLRAFDKEDLGLIADAIEKPLKADAAQEE